MILPPKALAVRLTLWSLLLAWAIWKMQPAAIGVNPDPPTPDARQLHRPLGTTNPVAVGGIIDPELLQRALREAVVAASECGVYGATVRATVGPTGLLHAELAGPATDEAAGCLAGRIWGSAWPAGLGEMEGGISLPTATPSPGSAP